MGRGSLFAVAIVALASCTAIPPVADSPHPVQNAAPRPAPPREPIRADFWLAGGAVQGSRLIGRVPSDTASLSFDGTEIPVTPDGFFLIAFDRDAGVSAQLLARLSDGRVVQRVLTIAPTAWQIEQVDASPTGGAATSAEFAARRPAELARINAARRVPVNSDGWKQDFIMPGVARISGRFGSQRVYRGQPASFHTGVDIALPAGTPFVAPADGVVTLAAAEPFTLEGRLLIVDHGMGLNSAFLHCSELFVREGDVVKQGQMLGRVGATGRASGPHLHWGMKWRTARIDPLLVVAKAPPR